MSFRQQRRCDPPKLHNCEESLQIRVNARLHSKPIVGRRVYLYRVVVIVDPDPSSAHFPPCHYYVRLHNLTWRLATSWIHWVKAGFSTHRSMNSPDRRCTRNGIDCFTTDPIRWMNGAQIPRRFWHTHTPRPTVPLCIPFYNNALGDGGALLIVSCLYRKVPLDSKRNTHIQQITCWRAASNPFGICKREKCTTWHWRWVGS